MREHGKAIKNNLTKEELKIYKKLFPKPTCGYGCWVTNTGDPTCPIHFPK